MTSRTPIPAEMAGLPFEEDGVMYLDEDVEGFQDWDVSQDDDARDLVPAPRGFSGAKGK